MEMQILSVIVWAIVLGLIVWLVNYIADTIPLPPPFNRFVKVAAVILAVVILIMLLLQLAGGGIVHLP